MPIVLITGGNSRMAQHLIAVLLNRLDRPELRVLVRPNGVASLKQAHPLLAESPNAIVVAERMEESVLTPAFRGVSVIVHDGLSVHEHDVSTTATIINAAKNAGVKHFLLCSVLHPMISKLISHRIKLQSEEYLVESRLDYTIVQPAHLMQNVSLNHVLRAGKILLGYSATVDQGFIDLQDFCLVLLNIIIAPEMHNKATYELVGENMPYTEVAKILQGILHKHVECEIIPPKEYVKMMAEGGMLQSEHAEAAVESIILYHNRWGLTGNSNVLRWLLGREPRSWRQYAIDTLSK